MTHRVFVTKTCPVSSSSLISDASETSDETPRNRRRLPCGSCRPSRGCSWHGGRRMQGRWPRSRPWGAEPRIEAKLRDSRKAQGCALENRRASLVIRVTKNSWSVRALDQEILEHGAQPGCLAAWLPRLSVLPASPGLPGSLAGRPAKEAGQSANHGLSQPQREGGREGGREGYGRPRERTQPFEFDAICMCLGDMHGVLHKCK